MSDRIIAVCTIILALIYFCASLKIPSLESGDPLGPKAFPILLALALVVAAALLWKETMGARKQIREETQESKQEKRELLLRAGGIVTWTLLSFISLSMLGYLLSTALYLFGLMAYLNPKKWLMNAMTSVLFTMGIYALFRKVLGVNLPPGIIHF